MKKYLIITLLFLCGSYLTLVAQNTKLRVIQSRYLSKNEDVLKNRNYTGYLNVNNSEISFSLYDGLNILMKAQGNYNKESIVEGLKTKYYVVTDQRGNTLVLTTAYNGNTKSVYVGLHSGDSSVTFLCKVDN